MTEPEPECNAKAERTGLGRWWAVCPNPKCRFVRRRNGKEDAEMWAQLHNEGRAR